MKEILIRQVKAPVLALKPINVSEKKNVSDGIT